MKKLPINIFLLLVLLLSSVNLFSQEVNIVPYLKQIDNGQKIQAMAQLVKLKDDYPDDPSVMFLEGVLTQNGQDAVAIYNKIINEHPKSRYADASVFRIYSYYYSLGLYGTANSFLNRLKNDYPNSPYIKIAEQRNVSITQPEVEPTPAQSVVQKPEPQQPKSNIEYKYTIQVGSFTNSNNSNNLKAKFESAGFYSSISEKNVAGTIFHIVFVGKFETKESAKKALDIINRQFNLDARVTTLNK